jgi:hypothetical protein
MDDVLRAALVNSRRAPDMRTGPSARRSISRKGRVGLISAIARSHEHPAGVGVILYPSRLNGEHYIAVYDRAFPAVECNGTVSLLRARAGVRHQGSQGRGRLSGVMLNIASRLQLSGG